MMQDLELIHTRTRWCFTANDVSVVLEVVGVPQSQFVFLHSSSLFSCLSLLAEAALYLPCLLTVIFQKS